MVLENPGAGAEHVCVLIAGGGGRTGESEIVVLNRIARSVIESERGKHPEYVFTYKGARLARMNNHAWRRARNRTGYRKFACTIFVTHSVIDSAPRGVSFEDRQDLLGHSSRRITTHYSAPDISPLLHAVNSICEQKRVTILRLAELPGKIPAVSIPAKSSALAS